MVVCLASLKKSGSLNFIPQAYPVIWGSGWMTTGLRMSEPILLVGIGILLALSLVFSVRWFTRSRLGRRAMKRLETVAPGAGDGAAVPPAAPAAPPEPRLDPSGLPPVPAGGPGVYPLHAAAGAEYGEGFAGNAHRHAPESWLTAVKYLIEVIGADVNGRDDGGYTPLHHAAARGDVEVINYLVSKGADVKAVSRRGQSTADMANGPVSRISPYPEARDLLVKLGAINNNKCASCAP